MAALVDNTVIFFMLKQLSGYKNNAICDDLSLTDSNARQRMRSGYQKNGVKKAWWPQNAFAERVEAQAIADGDVLFVHHDRQRRQEKLFEQQLYEVFWKYIRENTAGDGEADREAQAKDVLLQCCRQCLFAQDVLDMLGQMSLEELLKWLILKAKAASGEQDVRLVYRDREHFEVAREVTQPPAIQLPVERVAPMQEIGAQYRLLSQMPYSANRIIGREAELEEIARAFASGHRVVMLKGMDGIGKNALVTKYVMRHSAEYDCILFANFTGSVCQTVNTYRIQGMTRVNGETMQDYFQREMQVFRTLATERTLLVITNFNAPEDPDLELFLQGVHKVIFTSSVAHPGFYTIPVDALSGEDELLALFETYYGSEVFSEDVPALEKLFELVGNHTYAIELLARQMSTSFMTGRELLEAYRNSMLTVSLGELIPGRSGGMNTAFGHLCNIFSMDALDEQEVCALRVLSLAGSFGISAQKLRVGCGFDNYAALDKLRRKSWVKVKRGTVLQLHPVLARIARMVFPPTVENSRYFLEKLGDFLYLAWYRDAGRNAQLVMLVSNVIEAFQPFDPSFYSVWFQLGNYLWMAGEFDRAVECQRRLYDRCVEAYGEASSVTSCVACGVGDCYMGDGRDAEAAEWYRRALDQMRAAGVDGGEDLALICERMARVALLEPNRDCRQAMAYCDRAMAIYQQLRQEERGGETGASIMARRRRKLDWISERMAMLWLRICRVRQNMGDFEAALSDAEQGEDMLAVLEEQSERSYRSAIALAHLGKGVCTYALGMRARASGDERSAKERLSQALKWLLRAREENKMMRGSTGIAVLETEWYLADALLALGRCREAEELFAALQAALNARCGADDARTAQIARKLELARKGTIPGKNIAED